MSNSTIRSVAGIPAWGSTPFTPGVFGKRAMHRLSDGTLIAVIFDTNRNDIAGDGGDSSNLAKIYIYSSPDGLVWTLRATQVTDVVGTSSGNQGTYSSCIGPDNSVHLTWITNTFNAAYVIATYAAGNVFTLGTVRTLYTAGAGPSGTRVDIDTMGDAGQLAVVAVYTTGSTSSMNIKVYFALNGGTTITNPTSIVLNATVNGMGHYPDIAISACKDVITASTGTWVLIAVCVPASGSDPGDLIYTGQVNTVTGAVIGSTRSYATVYAPPDGPGQAAKRHWVITCISGRNFVIMRGLGTHSFYEGAVARFSLSSVGVLTYTTAFATANTSGGQTEPAVAADSNSGNAFCTAIYSAGSSQQKVLFLFTRGGAVKASSVYEVVCDLTTNQPVWRINARSWTSSFPAASGALTSVIAGSQRNLSSTNLDVLVTYNRVGGTFVARYHGLDALPAPTSILPANGSTISTDRPTLQGNYRNTYPYLQYSENMAWQIAADSGFTTNLKSQLANDKVFPANTDSVNAAIATAAKVVDASRELNQGTWFIRAYEVDEFGNAGAASVAQSFVITHLPVPANLYPNGGAIFAYGSGQVRVDWDFTDPSPYDFQTAYRIVVEDSLTSSTVYDSGKVVSTSTAATITIPVTSKDASLRWKVYLWDSDDVPGPVSDYQTFMVSDNPAPVITGPATLTSSVPTLTWTPGLSATKSQAAYRIEISTSGLTAYDSNWVLSSNLSAAIPPSYLHNATNYTFKVSVRDSLGLEGSTSVTLLSSWTAPLAADNTRVYLYEYDRKGFVFIGWSSLNISLDFVGWNVYRRAIGEIEWSLLYQTSEYRNSYGYRDYTAKSTTIYQYIVTQVTNINGDILESPLTTYTQVTTPTSRYWLLDSLGVLDAVPLYNATKDEFTDEWENEVFVLAGRGRHTDYGDHLGAIGQLTVGMLDRPTDANQASVNYFLDPSAQSHIAGNVPDYWTISGSGSFGNITSDYQTMYEPAPNSKLVNLFFRSDALGNTTNDSINLVQNITLDRLPVLPGNQFTTAVWFAKEPDPLNVANLSYVSVIQYYTAANALISTQTVAMVQAGTYEPATSGDANTGNFKRYQALNTLPVTTDHMTVTIRVKTSVAGQAGVVLGGASLDAGAVADGYFDGDLPGATWTAAPYSSSSSTSGFYLARDQRLDILDLKAAGRTLILRSPFGDFLRVNLDNIPFSREGGRGSSDVGELTIPYYEVGS